MRRYEIAHGGRRYNVNAANRRDALRLFRRVMHLPNSVRLTARPLPDE